MTEYGIFSEAAGGCVFHPCYSPEEAETERQRLIAEEGEPDEDLTVKEMCPDHTDEEQPKDGCEECFTEEPEDDETDEDEDY